MFSATRAVEEEDVLLDDPEQSAIAFDLGSCGGPVPSSRTAPEVGS